MRRIPLLLCKIIFCLGPSLSYGEGPLPLRQAVDIYNRIGSPPRLVAFMKIGLAPSDQTYLNYLSAEIEHQPLPRAFLAGNTVYLQGLGEPLKVIDLRSKLFSFGEKRLDLNLPYGLQSLARQLKPSRRAYGWLDFIFPEALAATRSSPSGSDVAGLLAVGGLSANLQCLSDTSCVPKPYMKSLAELGAVGAFRQAVLPAQVFCSVAARGGAKFNLAGEKQSLLSFVDGEEEELPKEANAKRAAQSLLSSCASPTSLTALNTALSYPASIQTDTVRRAASPRSLSVVPAPTTEPTLAPKVESFGAAQ